MRPAHLIAVILLLASCASCAQSPEEAAEAAKECRAHGGIAVWHAGLSWRQDKYGRPYDRAVRCELDYHEDSQ